MQSWREQLVKWRKKDGPGGMPNRGDHCTKKGSMTSMIGGLSREMERIQSMVRWSLEKSLPRDFVVHNKSVSIQKKKNNYSQEKTDEQKGDLLM